MPQHATTTEHPIARAIQEHAAAQPDAPALVELSDPQARGTTTYAQLARELRGLADVLAAHTNPADLVLIDGPVGRRFVMWTLAALDAGLTALPVPRHTAPVELAHLARTTNARATIGERPIDSVPTFIPWLATPNPASADPPDTPPGTLALQTSGTTGTSKVVLRSAASLDADAANVRTALRLAAQDRIVLAISPAHSYAIDILVGSLLAGSSVHIVPTFTVEAVLEAIRAGATVFPAVPFLLEGLAEANPPAHSLRLAISAGSPLPQSIRDRFSDVWGVPVADLYGATELGTVIYRDPGDRPPEPGLIGKPLPGVSARILSTDDSRTPLPPGSEGQLAIAAPSMLERFLDAPADLIDGHLPTGDLARIEPDGSVFLTGRTKLLIEVGGIKINPLEIEHHLNQHPGVRECAVVPLPVSDTISRLRAVFVATDPASPPNAADLRTFLRDRLGPIKVPRRFDAIKSLPRSAAGKIHRTKLAEATP